MAIDQIVQLLMKERDKLSRAIEALDAPAQGMGRPGGKTKAKVAIGAPAATVSAPPASTPKRKRKPLTAARRKALSARMKAYWAKRKKAIKS
jgi:hypothetical protein